MLIDAAFVASELDSDGISPWSSQGAITDPSLVLPSRGGRIIPSPVGEG